MNAILQSGFTLSRDCPAFLGGFRGWELLLAILLALASALVGYVLMARRVLSREDPRPIPELTRSKDEPGQGHTTVVDSTHGEPETYDPIGWINQFNEFDEQDIPFVPLVARPYSLRRLRLCDVLS